MPVINKALCPLSIRPYARCQRLPHNYNRPDHDTGNNHIRILQWRHASFCVGLLEPYTQKHRWHALADYPDTGGLPCVAASCAALRVGVAVAASCARHEALVTF